MKSLNKAGLIWFCVGALVAAGVQNGSAELRGYYLKRHYADESKIAEEFHVAIDACAGSQWESEFPDNKYCKEALALLTSSPMTTDRDDYIGHLQDRVLFFSTYSEWLECKAGVSVMGDRFCDGRKLKHIEMRD